MNNKGCVYFFKHIGLAPIKIGYSEKESPSDRFEQFKTYAPFGAELIGFIKTENAKRLETELHKKYSRDRLKGEWFDISIEEVKKCIKFYSDILDVKDYNDFQIAWANRNNIKDDEIELNVLMFSKIYSPVMLKGYIEVLKTTNELSEELLINNRVLRKIFRRLNINVNVKRVDGKTTSCYVLYKKTP